MRAVATARPCYPARSRGAGLSVAMGLVIGLVIGLVWVLSSAAPALARPDFRLSDRFFFGVHGGVLLSQVGQLSVASATDGSQIGLAHNQKNVLSPMVAIDTSFWPCDYAGLGFDLQLATLPSPVEKYTPLQLDLGLYAVLAVPLRYVQPYAGVRGGLRTVSLGGQGSEVMPSVYPLAGLHIYAHRRLRVFVQWQYAPLDYTVLGSKLHIRYADTGAQVLSAGLRYSPRFFHRGRGSLKFDLIWWSALFSVAAWGLGTWLGSKE